MDAKGQNTLAARQSDHAAAVSIQIGKALIICLAMGAIAGCANTALRTARDEIAAGHYATAHQQLLAARAAKSAIASRTSGLIGAPALWSR